MGNQHMFHRSWRFVYPHMGLHYISSCYPELWYMGGTWYIWFCPRSRFLYPSCRRLLCILDVCRPFWTCLGSLVKRMGSTYHFDQWSHLFRMFQYIECCPCWHVGKMGMGCIQFYQHCIFLLRLCRQVVWRHTLVLVVELVQCILFYLDQLSILVGMFHILGSSSPF